jgi:hypothetical protein
MNNKNIALAIILILICVSLSGCSGFFKTSEDNELGFASNIKVEEVLIDGFNETITVDKPDSRVKLIVISVDSDITISEDTILVEMVLDGIDNIIRVSQNHNYKLTDDGIENQIVYYD